MRYQCQLFRFWWKNDFETFQVCTSDRAFGTAGIFALRAQRLVSSDQYEMKIFRSNYRRSWCNECKMLINCRFEVKNRRGTTSFALSSNCNEDAARWNSGKMALTHRRCSHKLVGTVYVATVNLRAIKPR